MKTIETIKTEIKSIVKESLGVIKEAEIKKAQSRVKFLNDCIAYIETNPREEYVMRSLHRIEDKGNGIKRECKDVLNKEIAKAIKADANYTKLTVQLKTLKYVYK